MSFAPMEKDVHTQEELNTFLLEYDDKNSININLFIFATEDIVINEIDKDFSALYLNFSGSKVKFTVNTSFGRIKIFNSFEVELECDLPPVNKTRLEIFNSASIDLKLRNVFEVSALDSSIRQLDYNQDTILKEGQIHIRHGRATVLDQDVISFATVYIEEGGNVDLWGRTVRVNFVLTSNGNLTIYNRSEITLNNICAFDNSTITFANHYDYLNYSNKIIQIFDNAKVNTSFCDKKYKDIFEYCEKNDIEHTNTYGYFYKIVKKENNELVSLFEDDFHYYINKWVYPSNGFSEEDEICGAGIHCGSLNYVLRQFGCGQNRVILKLRVEFKDLAPYEPNAVPQKLRCKKAFVEKIVDPETLGARKILLNRS